MMELYIYPPEDVSFTLNIHACVLVYTWPSPNIPLEHHA